MDRAFTVEADPVSGLLLDILRHAEQLQKSATKDRVADPLDEGAAPLEGHVREPAARHFAGGTRIGRINNLA